MHNTWVEFIAVFALIELTIWKLRFWFEAAPWVVFAAILVLVARRTSCWHKYPAAATKFTLQILGVWPKKWAASWGWAAAAVVANSFMLSLFSPEVHSWLWPAMLFVPIAKEAAGYLLKAFAQQLVAQGYFTVQFCKLVRREWLVALVSGVLFGAAHFPNPFLVVLCGLNGVWSAWVFAKGRNIWPIVVAHALVAGAALTLLPQSWHHNFRVGPDFWR